MLILPKIRAKNGRIFIDLCVYVYNFPNFKKKLDWIGGKKYFSPPQLLGWIRPCYCTIFGLSPLNA